MGLNDPQWGKKNSGGPPDLDELLRKLNEKVAAMMGGKGGKGGEGKPGGGMPMKGFGGGIGLIAPVAVLIWLGSGFYLLGGSPRGARARPVGHGGGEPQTIQTRAAFGAQENADDFTIFVVPQSCRNML